MKKIKFKTKGYIHGTYQPTPIKDCKCVCHDENSSLKEYKEGKYEMICVHCSGCSCHCHRHKLKFCCANSRACSHCEETSDIKECMGNFGNKTCKGTMYKWCSYHLEELLSQQRTSIKERIEQKYYGANDVKISDILKDIEEV